VLRGGRDENWSDETVVARLVEVLQIESIIAYLIERGWCEVSLANLEFEDEDDRADEQDDVDAFSHARDGVLEIDAAFAADEDLLENSDLFQPRVALSLFEGEGINARELTENFIRGSGQKVGD
jgi:hypothetical protein